MSELFCGAKGYKGTQEPRCRNGVGCVDCWKKYANALEKKIERALGILITLEKLVK